MKLRKPCQHKDDKHPEGRYEAHVFDEPIRGLPGYTTERDCPGGVFLLDDTLLAVVERIVEENHWTDEERTNLCRAVLEVLEALTDEETPMSKGDSCGRFV